MQAWSFGPREWLFAAGLLAVVLLAYQPNWRGGFLWDDNAHVTRPEQQSWHGLYRIWFDVKATQQYYPLLHSAFWIEHRLWGDATLGYHLVNMLLHATAAVLAALILRRLAVPGAYWAAAVFALHPVHVESVAWITEQKNTLSAVFYLGAAMAYLHFDQERKIRFYWGALGLFMLGLLSKTVTATLPGALLVVFWWQRGRLSWRRDVRALLPFFALGAVAGVFTAWVELRLIGAEGEGFTFTFMDRCLLAGRVVCFYLGKLLWPGELIFNYPRWQVSAAVWWRYLFSPAVLLVLAALWALRRRTRGPLAGALFFVGTLFPVLGFINVYPFIFSFVADHFQYLASLGVITLASSGIVLLLKRWRLWGRLPAYLLCGLLLATLGLLTRRQSRMYADAETLYVTTLARNPESWMAHNNLGNVLVSRGRLNEAIEHFEKVLEVKPGFAGAHSNLGMALAKRGQLKEASDHFRKALAAEPAYAEAHYNLGIALAGMGQLDDAIAQYNQALETRSDYAEAHNNLGNALASRGQVDAAIDHFRRALEVRPDYVEAYCNLGNALARGGKIDAAVVQYQKALKINPDHAGAHSNLGNVLASSEQFDAAIEHYRKALELEPNYLSANINLAVVLAGHGRVREAITYYQRALQIKPDMTQIQNDLGWILATNPDASIRNGPEAVQLAQKASRRSSDREPRFLDTLAAAYAERGMFSEAVETARRAGELASAQGNPGLTKAIQARVRLYQTGSPYRQVPGRNEGSRGGP